MKQFHVIGVMSGTSLDGIDLAEIVFTKNENWSFQLKACATYAYPKHWVSKLSEAVTFSKKQLKDLDEAYTEYLSAQINKFIEANKLKNIDAVCSHGHTVLHEPKKGITLQIGNLPQISSLVNNTVVCNFRIQDVQLGGQGAPLVPIGDSLLFHDYDFCLNLGGFSNISFNKNKERVAYDICAVNVVLNFFANKLGLPYDENGRNAEKGNLNAGLLAALNDISFYKKQAPKSLGVEWVKATVFPIINKYSISVEDILRTFTEHIAFVIAEDMKASKHQKILITGGGAYNTFLIKRIKENCEGKIIVPKKELIEFKEALIFGFLGVLKLQHKINVLSSVTGAKKDHCAGFLYFN